MALADVIDRDGGRDGGGDGGGDEGGDGVGWARLVLDFAGAHPWMIAFNVAYLIVVPVAEIAMPHLYGRLVSVLQKRGGRRVTSLRWAQQVRRVFSLIVIVLVATRVVFYFAELLDARFTTALHAFVRDRSMARLLVVIQTRAEGSTDVGETVSKFIKLPWAVEHVVNAWRGAVLPKLAVFAAAAAYVAIVHDGAMAVLLLSLGLVYTVLVVYVPLHCCNQSMARDRLYNFIISDVDDILRNSVSVFSQGQEATERARVARRGEAYARAYRRMVICWLPAYGIVSVVTVIFLALFMWRTFVLASSARLSAAALVPVTVLMMYFVEAFASLPSVVRPLTMNYGTAIESSSILETDTDTQASKGEEQDLRDAEVADLVMREEAEAAAALQYTAREQPRGLSGCSPGGGQRGVRIEFRDVCYRYPGGSRNVLHNFCATFEPGVTTVVWGPIGCGKSTLISILLKNAVPSSGEVFIDGTPLSRIPTPALRRAMGHVPQRASLFDRSVLSNVLYGNTPCKGEADAVRVVTALGLMDGPDGFGGDRRVRRGLDVPAGKGGSSLSGGQRQAVLVARALLKDPICLVMDEPTSSMDTASKDLMRRALQSPAPDGLLGRTVIIVTHDEFILENIADRVLRMPDRT